MREMGVGGGGDGGVGEGGIVGYVGGMDGFVVEMLGGVWELG